MFTNTNGCTVYERTVRNRAPTYIRHELGAVYCEVRTGEQKVRNDAADRIFDNETFIVIPEKSAAYVPKADDKIVCGIIGDERPPNDALTIVKVRDFRYGSPKIRHIEVTAR